jgi:hypothetical protein
VLEKLFELKGEATYLLAWFQGSISLSSYIAIAFSPVLYPYSSWSSPGRSLTLFILNSYLNVKECRFLVVILFSPVGIYICRVYRTGRGNEFAFLARELYSIHIARLSGVSLLTL